MPAYKYKQYYQDGSAARNVYTAAPVPEEFFEEDPQVKKERAIRVRKAKRLARVRAQAKAARNKKLAVIGICIGVAFVVGAGVLHLTSRGEVAQRANEAERLQSVLTELTGKNEALEAEINKSVDYDAIKDTAMNEYGMVYPGDGQIITYNADGEGYIKQYKDID